MESMKVRLLFLVTAIIALFAGTVMGDSEFFKKFKRDYDDLNMDLLNNMGEKAKIKDFVYHKDIATFTFKEGVIHLLRYIEGRPTTAIFVGRGNAKIIVPAHVERKALEGISRDSIVNEDFEVAIIRMADDFDLLLKEQFTFELKELKWKTFTIAKQSHGEQFFKPSLLHTYDNYFQLLRSIYERSGNGYFWIDFNRYIFSFDPNRPEQVAVDYEFGVADLIAAPAAAFQRKEIGIYKDRQMSDIRYPTTILEKRGRIEMGGIDGLALDSAEVTVTLLLNVDSLRFISLFLPTILDEDSIYFNGQPVDYHRRRDFDFIGIILPEYRYRGDTLQLTIWYHGKNFNRFLPYVENPQVCPHNFTFTVPKNFNYFMPGMSAIEPLDNKRSQFFVSSSNQYNDFYFHVYPSDIDTLPVQSDVGIMLNFLKQRHISKRLTPCFISDDVFQASIVDAFNYMTARLGSPPNTFVEYIVPERLATMPGLIMVPQTSCALEGRMTDVGGFDVEAGVAVARQWFGSLLRPASDREMWIIDAVPQYLSLMFLHNKQGVTYLNNLIRRRDSIYTDVERKWDIPIACGSCANASIRTNKGIWLLHMLRFLMYDLEQRMEGKFLRFLQELAITCNARTFTNEDIINLAEKHYGQPLDWFFQQWLYGRNLPEFNVEYKIYQRGDEHFINVKVATKGVDPSFIMPVAMQVVEDDDNWTYLRETVSVPQTEFTLGPFASKPKKFVFNEFYSVLSKDKVKKK